MGKTLQNDLESWFLQGVYSEDDQVWWVRDDVGQWVGEEELGSGWQEAWDSAGGRSPKTQP